MKKYQMVIKGRLPGLNEYVLANRSNRFAGSSMKKKCQEAISKYIEAQLPNTITPPVEIDFRWYEKDGRRDLDNICFAKKFILDALVTSGRLEDDNRKFVTGFRDRFFIDKENPRIEVEIKEVENG